MQKIKDTDGDWIAVRYEKGGLTVDCQQIDGGERTYTIVGPVDPHKLIEAIKIECELHEDDDEPQEDTEVGPVTQKTAEQLSKGGLNIGRAADHFDYLESTGESQLRTLDEEGDAHQHLAQHWDRRLAVARQALSMTPVRGESKPVGIAAVFGTERSGEVSVTDALKIARFAADEDRDIPGVDK